VGRLVAALLQDGGTTHVHDADALEATIARHYARGRERYPDLDLSDTAFAKALARHVEGSGEKPLVPDELHAEDFFLAAACTLGVKGAVEILSREHLSQVPVFIAHVCKPSDPEKPEDVAQAIAERVVVWDGDRAPRITAYSGRGALGGWLRVLAVRLALNAKRGSQPPVEMNEELLPAGDDPEIDLFKWQYRDAFKKAFEAAFTALDEEQRLVLRLHTSKNRGEDIAKILGVERSTVMRRLARARETLFEATKQRMMTELRLSATEFESIARALQSNIELTLSRVLAHAVP